MLTYAVHTQIAAEQVLFVTENHDKQIDTYLEN